MRAKLKRQEGRAFAGLEATGRMTALPPTNEQRNRGGRATAQLKANHPMTARPDPNESPVQEGRANHALKATHLVTALSDPKEPKDRGGRARSRVKATGPLTARPDPNEQQEGRATRVVKAVASLTALPPTNEPKNRDGRADAPLKAKNRMTARPVTNEPSDRKGRATRPLKATVNVTASSDPNEQQDLGGRARVGLKANDGLTARPDPEMLQEIRMAYRFAKAAEQSRLRIDQGFYAFARVHLTGWDPNADAKERKKNAGRAKSVVDALIKGKAPPEDEAMLYHAMEPLVTSAIGSRRAFEELEKKQEKLGKALARQLPAWSQLSWVRGFSEWGLAVIVGEAGDIGAYSGCRHLFKRLGLAPDECYPTGEKKTGRMIPRQSRGRIMGVIAEPLLRQQWRAAKAGDDGGGESQRDLDSQGEDDLAAATVIPAHAIGPFGTVYADAKVRQLAAGKEKGHADKLARRAMVKALLHDVHHAWHGLALDYIKAAPDA